MQILISASVYIFVQNLCKNLFFLLFRKTCVINEVLFLVIMRSANCSELFPTGKKFRSQSHLFEHRAVHSEHRNFLCEVCGASFKTRSVHRKHVQSIHRNPKAFSCEVCCKKFNTQYTLKRHKKTHKPKPNDLSACENNSDVPGIPYNSPQSASESDCVPIQTSDCVPIQPVVNPVSVMPVFPVGVNVLQQSTPLVIPNPEPPAVVFINSNLPQL